MLVYQRVSVVFHAYFTHTSQVLQAVGLLGPDGTSQRQRGIVVFINVWSRTWGSPSLRICPTFLSVEGWLWFYLSRVPIFFVLYLGISWNHCRKTATVRPKKNSSPSPSDDVIKPHEAMPLGFWFQLQHRTTSDMSTSSITHRTNEVFLSDLQQSD